MQCGIPLIVRNWREQYKIGPDVIVDAILACDAATFKPVKIGALICSNCFAFLVLPLSPFLKSFVVHLLPWESGSMGESAVPYCTRIAGELKKCNIVIIAGASDGDRAYVPHQTMLFEHFLRIPEKRKFLGQLTALDALCDIFDLYCNSNLPEKPMLWVADMLHALKCQRCRLRNRLYIVPCQAMTFNNKDLNDILQLRYSLTLMNGTDRMNDIKIVKKAPVHGKRGSPTQKKWALLANDTERRHTL
jgi:hypothetical protein